MAEYHADAMDMKPTRISDDEWRREGPSRRTLNLWGWAIDRRPDETPNETDTALHDHAVPGPSRARQARMETQA
jgi:hypothetical protein|tara:strand:- start:451 stop:672 length:222 start_codon:yes stop_codon:yes gene_type:complete